MITSGLYYPPSNTKADVRHGNSARTQKGEKRGEKRGWVWVGKKKKNRKKESVLLFCHKLLVFSFIPSVEGRAGVQRAGPGAEGSSALLWGP